MSGRTFAAAMVLGLAGSVVTPAQATVYRCGPDGRSYSQQPCAEGRAIDVDDARPAGERADAAAAVRRNAALAQRLERERHLAESRAPRAVGLSAPRPGAAKPVRAEPPRARPRTKARAAKSARPMPAVPPKTTPGGATR